MSAVYPAAANGKRRGCLRRAVGSAQAEEAASRLGPLSAQKVHPTGNRELCIDDLGDRGDDQRARRAADALAQLGGREHRR